MTTENGSSFAKVNVLSNEPVLKLNFSLALSNVVLVRFGVLRIVKKLIIDRLYYLFILLFASLSFFSRNINCTVRYPLR